MVEWRKVECKEGPQKEGQEVTRKTEEVENSIGLNHASWNDDRLTGQSYLNTNAQGGLITLED